ncbi:MAG: tetratricopeptide repeat protein [Clostridiaceae bacterium]|jgi:tetratricopeptide (TPR) repeat protein|nr:tetratricopeptide repeat protein [Clostridiaceae bacterium]
MNIIEDLERKLDQLVRMPDDPRILNDIGVLLYQLEDWKNAEMYLQRAWELDPTNKDILYNYGLLLHLQFKLQEAVRIFEVYLELYPDDRDVVEKMGDSYYQLGECEAAAKMFNQLRGIRKEGHLIYG